MPAVGEHPTAWQSVQHMENIFAVVKEGSGSSQSHMW